jgi:hypothetical protein
MPTALARFPPVALRVIRDVFLFRLVCAIRIVHSKKRNGEPLIGSPFSPYSAFRGRTFSGRFYSAK